MEGLQLTALPDELLRHICRGRKLRLQEPVLLACSKLHRAWQKVVAQLTISDSRVKESDIALIAKYINLKHLDLSGLEEGDVPAWFLIAELSGRLQHLATLAVSICPGTFSVLRGLYGTSLAARLTSLELDHEAEDITAMDFWGLACLTALECLTLKCRSYAKIDAEHLRSICSKLVKLRNLKLTTEHISGLPMSFSEAFPGSLTALTALMLMTWDEDITGANNRIKLHHQRHLVASVSALTNLRELDTNYILDDADAQRDMLGPLWSLTSLQLSSLQRANLTGLAAEHDELEVLAAPYCTFTAPYEVLECLRRMDVGRLLASQRWRGAVLADSQMKELYINSENNFDIDVSDADYANLPTLPLLHTFRTAGVQPSGSGRYVQLAGFLRRHAVGLRQVALGTSSPFQEALPAALPRCYGLELSDRTVSRHTLQLLRACALPELRVLRLGCVDSGAVLAEDVEADWGWLAGLPSLTHVIITVRGAGAAGLKVALVAMLPGRSVRVSSN